MSENHLKFKRIFAIDLSIYDLLKTEEGRFELAKKESHQWLLDGMDHLQRFLTKGTVHESDKRFAADVVLWMFNVPGFSKEVFDDIEKILGSEHFVKDLLISSKRLSERVERLKAA